MPTPKTPTAVVVVAERAARGWSQADLADALKAHDPDTPWSRSRVRRLEAGELVVDVDVLLTLSAVLDVDLETLIRGFRAVSRTETHGQSDTTNDLRECDPSTLRGGLPVDVLDMAAA